MKTLMISCKPNSSFIPAQITELVQIFDGLDCISGRNEERKTILIIRNVNKSLNEINLLFTDYLAKKYGTNPRPLCELFYGDLEGISKQ